MSDLIERLEEHARLHDELAMHGDEEQAQWARDLREAAAELRRAREAPVVVFDSEEDDDEPRLSEWRQNEVVALHGHRVRLVPERGEVG